MSDRPHDEDDHGILDSVRRILAQSSRDEERAASLGDDGVLDLDRHMMIDPPEPMPMPMPEPVPVPPRAEATPVLGADASRAAGRAFATLRTASREQAALRAHRSGPTLEDMIREELRPMLQAWLDSHLPPVVERLVQAEIARIAAPPDGPHGPG